MLLGIETGLILCVGGSLLTILKYTSFPGFQIENLLKDTMKVNSQAFQKLYRSTIVPDLRRRDSSAFHSQSSQHDIAPSPAHALNVMSPSALQEALLLSPHNFMERHGSVTDSIQVEVETKVKMGDICLCLKPACVKKIHILIVQPICLSSHLPVDRTGQHIILCELLGVEVHDGTNQKNEGKEAAKIEEDWSSKIRLR
jgi:hypothetical protein